MPLPEFQINTVELHLRNVPANLPQSEQHKALALAGISYGVGIMNLIAHASREKVYGEHTLIDPEDTSNEEFDAALFCIGSLGKGLLDDAFGHVMAMAEEYEKEIDQSQGREQTPDQLAA